MLRGFGQAFGIRSMSGTNINVSSVQNDSTVFPPVKYYGRGGSAGQHFGTVANPMHNTVPSVESSNTSPSSHSHHPVGSVGYMGSAYKASSLGPDAGTTGDDSFEIYGRANVDNLLETGHTVDNSNNNNPLKSSPTAVSTHPDHVITPPSLHPHPHTHSTGTHSYHSTVSVLSSPSQVLTQPPSQPSSHHSHGSVNSQHSKSPYHDVTNTNTSGSGGRKTTTVGLIPAGSSGSGGSGRSVGGNGRGSNGGMTSGYDDDVDRLVVSTLPTLPPTLFSSPVGQDRHPTPSLPKTSPNPPVVNPFQDLPLRSSPTNVFVPPAGVNSTELPLDEQTQINPEQAPELWNTPPRTVNNIHPSRTPNTTRRNNDEKAEWDNIMNNMWSPG